MKSLLHVVATLLVLPVIAWFWIVSIVSSKDQALTTCSQGLSRLPGLTGCYLRSAFYASVLEEFHPTARLEYGTLLSKCSARIKQNVYVGPYCLLGLVTLHEDVLLGPAVQIPSGGRIHGIDSLDEPIRNQPGAIQRTTIGRNCWIGGQAVVLADVEEQTVIGAGSVVTKALPPRVVAAGNPAVVIRSRETSSQAS